MTLWINSHISKSNTSVPFDPSKALSDSVHELVFEIWFIKTIFIGRTCSTRHNPRRGNFSTTHRMWHISRVHVVRNWIYLFMKPSLVSGIDLDMNFDPEHWISLWLSRMQSWNQFWCSQLAMMMWMEKLRTVWKVLQKLFNLAVRLLCPFRCQHFCKRRNSVKV